MITGIILASGFSQRMHTEKLLLNVEGMPVVERVIKASKLSRLDRVLLVYQKDEIKELGTKHNITTVYNHKAHEGQSAAIKEGILASPPETRGFMFLVADQPFLDPYTINTLIEIFTRKEAPIVAPLYNGMRGNPVIFSSRLKDELLNLEGDCGGRTVIDQMQERVTLVAIDNALVGMDIDTQEEYEMIQK